LIERGRETRDKAKLIFRCIDDNTQQ